MVKDTDFIPGFLDKKQTQHYAFSWVEFIAHKKLNELTQNSEFREQYPHVMYRQDAWLTQFQLHQRKLKDRNAQALVELYNDVITGEVTTLKGFYSRFNRLLKPKRGKALQVQKRILAGVLGAIENAGVEAIDNTDLFKAIHRLAAKVSHTGASQADLEDALSLLIRELHDEQLSNSQHSTLFDRLQKKVSIMEEQLSALEAQLLRMRNKDGKPDKAAFNAYHLYGLIKLNTVVGETIAKAQEDWASLVPFGEKAVQPALSLLVKLNALEVIEKGKASSFAGKATVYRRLL